MKVRDLMTTNVASAPSHEPLTTAARLMWECDCGTIPVVDSASDRVIGMITDRDICMATWSKDRAPSAISISEAMSRDLFYCSPDDKISSAATLMRSKQIRRLPVLNTEGRLVGIISLADIVTQSQTAGSRASAIEVAPNEIAATLARICEPRPMPVESNLFS